jgi:hypothetical protein
MQTYKGYEIDRDNLGRVTVYNPNSPYSRDSDHRIFGTIKDAKQYINEQYIDEQIDINEATAQSGEVSVYLTCTAHGKPVYTTCEADLPDRGVTNPPPIRKVGPYVVGPEGYADIKEALESDPSIDVDLDDPLTWFEDSCWIDAYLDE